MTQRGNHHSSSHFATGTAESDFPEGKRFKPSDTTPDDDAYDYVPQDEASANPYSRANVGYTPKTGTTSRRKFVAIGTAAGAVAILGASAGIAASTALGLVDDAKAQISRLSTTANELANALKGLSFDTARNLCPTLSQQVAELNATLSNGLVSVAGGVTPYGADIKAARTLLSGLQDIIDNALTPLFQTLACYSFETLVASTENGVQFNLDGVQNIVDALVAAMPSIKSFLSSIDGIDKNLRIQQLADIVSTIADAYDAYGHVLDAADLLLPLLPGMLGAQGPASYLVVAQSNAELAATGGFPGAMGLATADAGLVSMGGFGSVWDVLGRQAEPLPLTDEEVALYGEAIGFAPDAMGHDPDFPRAAELWALSCAQTNGVSPAGVAALDPVFLQGMLGLAGASVPMPDGTSLDGSGAARALLSDVYWRYLGDTDAQDAYFAAAAAGAAEAVMAGLPSADPAALAGALASAVRSRRLNLWLADGRGQEALRALGADNGVAGDPAEPELGVYLSDEVWAKISWYLGARVELGPAREGPDGRRRVPVELALSNGITEEEALAAGGDAYIVGYNEEAKRRDGDSSYTVTLYAPAGGDLEGFSAGPTPSGWAPEARRATHLGRQVLQFSAKMLPGEELVASFEAVLPEGCGAELGLDMTPLAQGAQVVRA